MLTKIFRILSTRQSKATSRIETRRCVKILLCFDDRKFQSHLHTHAMNGTSQFSQRISHQTWHWQSNILNFDENSNWCERMITIKSLKFTQKKEENKSETRNLSSAHWVIYVCISGKRKTFQKLSEKNCFSLQFPTLNFTYYIIIIIFSEFRRQQLNQHN